MTAEAVTDTAATAVVADARTLALLGLAVTLATTLAMTATAAVITRSVVRMIASSLAALPVRPSSARSPTSRPGLSTSAAKQPVSC